VLVSTDAPGASDPASAVDPSRLDALTARLGDRGPTFRVSLVQTWRDEAACRLAELDAAAQAGDAEGVGRGAHTLKSGSAALGAGPLAALCERVESSVRAGEERDLHADASCIRHAVEAASEAFRRLWEVS
jgi:HPt (histidine-containing phosphotransfer) domain-containing protein